MLKSFGVSGFKGIGDLASLELRPITLVFGPNSSGKSSLLQSLLVLDQVLRRGSADVFSTELGGKPVDAGGFRQYAHRGDVERGVTWNLDLSIPEPEVLIPRPAFDVELKFEVNIHHDSNFTGRQLMYIGIFDSDGILFSGRQSAQEEGPTRTGGFVNPNHPLALKYVEQVRKRAMFRGVFSECSLDPFQLAHVIFPLASWGLDFTEVNAVNKSFLLSSRYVDTTLLVDGAEYSLMYLTAGLVSERLRDVVGAIADVFADEFSFGSFAAALVDDNERDKKEWTEVETVWADSGYGETFGPLTQYSSEFREALDIAYDSAEIDALLKIVHADLNELVSRPRRALEPLRYLGPMRAMPARSQVSSQVERGDSALGEDEWHRLVTSESLREALNEWLGDDKLGTSLRLTGQRLLPEADVLEVLSNTLKESRRKALQVEDLAEHLSRVQHVGAINRLVDLRTNTTLSLRDVGFGVGQVLPVIARTVGTQARLHLIEQPEIHLHPALQAELADLFIESARNHENSFLLETHSEHLILRVLRRIREATRRDDQGPRALKPEDVAVYYVSRGEQGEVSVAHIEVSGNGDFLDPWPGGFFPERLEELI